MGRAAINIGPEGDVIDFTVSGSVGTVTVEHPEAGIYLINGTLGLAVGGWGIITNPADGITADSSYADGILQLSVTRDGEPTDIKTLLTMHLEMEDVPLSMPEPPEPVVLTPEEEAAALKVQRLEAIAARRYEEETKGITVNGIRIDTGRDSQALITGAALAAMLDSAYTCRWKTASGFIELNAQQLLAIATAIRAHVQACFDQEAELTDAVEKGIYQDSMLDQGWPV